MQLARLTVSGIEHATQRHVSMPRIGAYFQLMGLKYDVATYKPETQHYPDQHSHAEDDNQAHSGMQVVNHERVWRTNHVATAFLQGKHYDRWDRHDSLWSSLFAPGKICLTGAMAKATHHQIDHEPAK